MRGVLLNRFQRRILKPLGFLLLSSFALHAAEATNEASPIPPFVFSGGSPEAFITAVQRHFSVDWEGAVRIPELMNDARLPKMNISASDPLVLLKYYNDVTAQLPALGTWVWQKDPKELFYVILVPDAKRVGTELDKRTDSMTSISMREVPSPVWTNLMNEIEAVRKEIADVMAERNFEGLPPNQVTTDGRTSLLFVRGSTEFQERVKAIVERYVNPAIAKRMAQEIRTFSITYVPPSEWPAMLAVIDATRDALKAAAVGENRIFSPEGRTTLDPETRLLFAIGTSDYIDVVRQALQAYRESRTAQQPR